MPTERRPRKQSGPAPVEPIMATPGYDQIERRAYELYQTRGGGDGQDQEDWFQAERDLRTPAASGNGSHA